jgi:YD repeat-containing protein
VYDAAQRVVAQVDALGFRTSFGYDATSRRNSVQDALGNFTKMVGVYESFFF